jgi:hypothetical protein
VVDAYFSRNLFVSTICKQNIEVISRLRDDANLTYPYFGPHPKRKGAKRKFQGKFDARNLDESYFTCCLIQKDESQNENYALYETTLYWVQSSIVPPYHVNYLRKYSIYLKEKLPLRNIKAQDALLTKKTIHF